MRTRRRWHILAFEMHGLRKLILCIASLRLPGFEVGLHEPLQLSHAYLNDVSIFNRFDVGRSFPEILSHAKETQNQICPTYGADGTCNEEGYMT